jgi:hypothetical protein
MAFETDPINSGVKRVAGGTGRGDKPVFAPSPKKVVQWIAAVENRLDAGRDNVSRPIYRPQEAMSDANNQPAKAEGDLGKRARAPVGEADGKTSAVPITEETIQKLIKQFAR